MTGAVTHETILEGIEDIKRLIGSEHHDHTGHLVATGMFSRFITLETRIGGIERERDRWKRDIAVATAVIVAVFGFVAWLESDRLDHVRKVITTPAASHAEK